MRNVALDLGSRTTLCEVAGGAVIRRLTATGVSQFEQVLGPQTPKAKVAVEACREAWFWMEKLTEWGHEPVLVDTTRVRQLGIAQHGRKTDRIDAEVLARALERGMIPVAHHLSPFARQLRYELGIRRTLVGTLSECVVGVRGVLRAHGVRLPKGEITRFRTNLEQAGLRPELRELIAPLEAMLSPLETSIATAEAKLDVLCRGEPVIAKLRTTPGVGPVIAASYVSVIDHPWRFGRAHEVEAYLGLVPTENTSGKRRLGSITKQGNDYLRSLLVEAGWNVMQRKEDDPLKTWGAAIAERRRKRIAAVGLARRLAGILWAMWRDGTVYDPERVGLASAEGLKAYAQSRQQVAEAVDRSAHRAARRKRWVEQVLARRNGIEN